MMKMGGQVLDNLNELQAQTREVFGNMQPLGEWLDYWINDIVSLNYHWESNTYERANRIIENNIKLSFAV